MSKRTRSVVCGAMLAMSCAAGAEEYVSGDPAFSFEVPEGWTRVPGEELDALRDTVYGIVEDRRFEYVDAYALDGSFVSGVYLIVQTSDHALPDRISWAEYESAMRDGFGGVPEILHGINERAGERGVPLGSEFTGYTFEQEKRRTVLRFTQDDPALGVSYGVSYMFPGSGSQVQINYYFPEGASELLGVIERSADSFEMGASNTWTPGPGSGSGTRYTPIIVGAITGGLAAAIVAMRRKKAAG